MRQPRRPGLRPGPLAALAGAVVLAAALGLLPRWPGLVHFVALPPLDVVNDLGALLVAAPSRPLFLLGVVASLVGRAALLAWMLGGLTRARFWFALRFYLVAWPLAFVAAVLVYAAGALLFAALFWFGVALALALLLAVGGMPWSGDTRLRDGFVRLLRRGLRAGTLGAYVLALTAVGAVADLTRPAGPVLLVPVSAAVTFAAASLLHVDTGWRVPRRAAAALTGLGVLALAVIAARGPGAPPDDDGRALARAGSVMLIAGIDSSTGQGPLVEIDPAWLGWSCEQAFAFSYAGPGDPGDASAAELCVTPLGTPYEREDTLRGRDELVTFAEAQVAVLEGPATVLGHSQSAWVLWDAASRDRLPGVETIVLVGALPQNPVSYPAAGERAAGTVGRFLLDHVDVVGLSVFEPDSPLGRDWLGNPDAIEETFERPVPEGVRVLSLTSMFDLPLMPDGYRVEGATNACPVPVIHPNLPYSSGLRTALVRFAEGESQPRCPVWRTATGPLFRHFTVMPSR